MDEKSLEMLEFPKIREVLAEFTSFDISSEMALALKPSIDPERVSLLLTQSAEARDLTTSHPNFSTGRVIDIRENIMMATKEKILDALALVRIQETIASMNRLRASFSKISNEYPSLASIANRIVPLADLEDEIGRCIDKTGDVLDAASPDLANLRQQVRVLHRQLLNRMEMIVKTLGAQNLLQDSIITERSGRYVIPVKAELQHEVRGIIHDISNTGATVFIEPLTVVEVGNDLRQAVLEEEREIQRILSELSSEVGANSEEILQNLMLYAEIDLAMAKAQYAQSMKAVEPSISIGERGTGTLKLVKARHPLLKEKAVPLSVEIGKDFSTLIITGPNTGGKTVALKTIGLLVLMAQSGIPVPASEDSCVPVFDNVFADIGDEQSIEQTLSTFSWHMSNIVRIMDASTSKSLILLDELGGSTDPMEGAALARAILLHFHNTRASSVATTHYSELKVFAHSMDGMQNASLEFDPVTLTPTYRMMLGIPGGSNALAIASQIGLSSEIIESAKTMLSKGAQEIEDLLADLMVEKQEARMLSEELEREKQNIEKIRNEAGIQLKEIQDQRTHVLQAVKERITREAAQLHRQIRQVESELKKTKAKASVESARKELDTIREALAGPDWQVETAPLQTDSDDAETDFIDVGDTVRVIDTSFKGTVISRSEKGDVLEVRVGRMKIKVSYWDVQKMEALDEKPVMRSFIIEEAPEKKRRSIELDLRGKRADEVEPELDSYLNDVSIAGFHEVRIIHGYGTGTVRQIVRDMLASYPLVKSFRFGKWDEGGDGVTIVKL